MATDTIIGVDFYPKVITLPNMPKLDPSVVQSNRIAMTELGKDVVSRPAMGYVERFTILTRALDDKYRIDQQIAETNGLQSFCVNRVLRESKLAYELRVGSSYNTEKGVQFDGIDNQSKLLPLGSEIFLVDIDIASAHGALAPDGILDVVVASSRGDVLAIVVGRE